MKRFKRSELSKTSPEFANKIGQQMLRRIFLITVVLLSFLAFGQGCKKPLSDIISIDGELAIKNDGTVWAFGGFNHRGQRGAGDKIPITYDIYYPNQVVAPEGKGYLSGITAVSGNMSMGVNLALKNDGTVWAWGDNSFGQLGNETIPARRTNKTKSYSAVPVQVNGLNNIRQVVADSLFCMALKNDGSVWVWGAYSSGVIPLKKDTGERYTSKPIQIPGLTDVVSIATNGVYGFALKDDGAVWVWCIRPELEKKKMYKLILIQLPRLNDISYISAGFGCFVAIQKNGSVWAWGTGWAFFLLDTDPGYLIEQYPPIKVPGLNDVMTVDVGFQTRPVVVKKDGTVWRFYYQVPVEENKTDILHIEQVTGITDVKSTTLGGCYILKRDGTVWKVEEDTKTKSVKLKQVIR
ncbi:MAG: hypothetical protein AB1599_03240 [Planctomycetota bacterium]